MATVLIVDDDRNLLKVLQRTLTYEGLNVVTSVNGREALDLVATHHPEVIILDWLLPELDGLAVLQQLRAQNDPVFVLMLTARDALENRVEGLEGGADDYLVKPFAPAELVARVKAMLRRVEARPLKQVMAFDGLTLDPNKHEAYLDEARLRLTPTEYELLHCFLQYPGIVLERARLLSLVWGYDFDGDDNVVEVYVGHLRRKLEAGGRQRLIHTIRSVGYILQEE